MHSADEIFEPCASTNPRISNFCWAFGLLCFVPHPLKSMERGVVPGAADADGEIGANPAAASGTNRRAVASRNLNMINPLRMFPKKTNMVQDRLCFELI